MYCNRQWTKLCRNVLCIYRFHHYIYISIIQPPSPLPFVNIVLLLNKGWAIIQPSKQLSMRRRGRRRGRGKGKGRGRGRGEGEGGEGEREGEGEGEGGGEDLLLS